MNFAQSHTVNFFKRIVTAALNTDDLLLLLSSAESGFTVALALFSTQEHVQKEINKQVSCVQEAKGERWMGEKVEKVVLEVGVVKMEEVEVVKEVEEVVVEVELKVGVAKVEVMVKEVEVKM